MRFLCLHGMGTSPAIFKAQLAPILSALRRNGHEFVFVDGKLDCEPGKDIDTFFSGPYRCYYTHPSPTALLTARAQILNTISRDGPFDAVMGFSQGAALAAALLIEAAKLDPYSDLFSLAVFIDSPMPYDLIQCEELLPLEMETPRATRSSSPDDLVLVPECVEEDGSEITIPTVHVMGEKDEFFPLGKKLLGLCSGENRVLVHPDGHIIPRDTVFTKKFVSAIEELVEELESYAA